MSVRFFSGWIRWCDRFLPPGRTLTLDETRRARLLVAGSLAVAPLVALATAVRAILASVPPLAVGALLTLIGLLCLAPLLLRWTGRLTVAATLPPTALLVAVTLTAVGNGGFEAPAVMSLVLVPILATFLVGPRSGVAFAAAAALSIFLLLLLESYELLPSTALPDPQILRLARLSVLLVVLTAASVVIWLFETHRRRVQQSLIESERRAAAASRAKSEFLATMSHELRTPLNAVLGFSRVMLKNPEGRLSKDHLHQLERIHANGRHLLSLVSDILDFSSLEGGNELPVSSESVDLRELLDQVVEGRLAQAANGVALRQVLPPKVQELRTDRRRLHQIVDHLVDNALKFTDRGEVVVRLVTHEASSHPLFVEVQDTGLGIAAEDLRRIFDPFSQLDQGPARQYGGSGLGLAISLALSRRLGFELTASSAPDRGSTFSVLFEPLAKR